NPTTNRPARPAHFDDTHSGDMSPAQSSRAAYTWPHYRECIDTAESPDHPCVRRAYRTRTAWYLESPPRSGGAAEIAKANDYRRRLCPRHRDKCSIADKFATLRLTCGSPSAANLP